MATHPIFPLSFSSWGDQEIAAIQEVITRGQFTLGPKVKEFERAYAEYLGVKHAVMMNSGSSANLAAVASLFYLAKKNLVAGDEAIVPALAWSTTYAPLAQYGLKIKLVDIDLETLNVDIAALEKAITPRTKLLVGVSILGNPAPLVEMRRLADRYNLIFLEDNCESLGAKINGKYTGTFGDLATCSFFFAHHISTMEGGMLSTDNTEIFELACALRAHGWTRELPSTSLLIERSEDTFQEAYRFLIPGYNLRPLEFSGAVGLCQLKKISAMNQLRRQNAHYFRELFCNDSRFQIQKEHGESSAYCFTFIVRPNSGLTRSQVLSHLRQSAIEFRMITGGNIARHAVAKHLNLDIHQSLTNADLVHDQGFFVGNGPLDLRREIDHLHKTLAAL
jgi:CDP-4-dehydro-6-deoxyglucose reductase, E1